MKTLLKNKPTFYLFYIFCAAASLSRLRDEPQFAFGSLVLPFVPLGGALLFLHLLKKRNLKYPYVWANVLAWCVCVGVVALLSLKIEVKMVTLIYLFSFQAACLYDDIRFFNKRLFKEIKVYAHVYYIKRPVIRFFCWLCGFASAFFSLFLGIVSSLFIFSYIVLFLTVLSCYFPFLLCCLFKKIGEKAGMVPVRSKYALYLFDFLGACLTVLCAAIWGGIVFVLVGIFV